MQNVLYWQTHTIIMVISRVLIRGESEPSKEGTTCDMLEPLFTLPSSVLRFVSGLLLRALRCSLKNILAHVEITVVKVKLNLRIMITYFYRDYCSTTRWRFARSYTICWSVWGWYCWCQPVRFHFIWEECHQRYEKTLARRNYSLCHLRLFQ